MRELRYRLLRAISRIFESRICDVASADGLIVVRTDRLGDLAVTVPALAELKKGYPDKPIVLVAGPANVALGQLVQRWGIVDEVVVGISANYGPTYPQGTSVWEAMRPSLVGRTVVFFLTPDLLPVVRTRLLGKNVRVRVTTKVAKSLHERDVVAATLGVSLPSGTFTRSAPADRRVAITLNAHPLRSWGIQNWISLLDIFEQRAVQVLIVGDESTADKAEVLASRFPTFTDNFVGRTHLRDLPDLLGRCRCLIGTDSGLMHFGSVIGVPTITLFGPSLPQQWAPVGSSASVLYQSRHCSPCTLKRCPYPDGRRCLDDISVQEVWERVGPLVDYPHAERNVSSLVDGG